MSSERVRGELVEALREDLVGPMEAGSALAEEVLPMSPTQWYLTGFLAPWAGAVEDRSDQLGLDELDEAQSGDGEEEEGKAPERSSARRVMFPSSIGLTVLVDAETEALEVEARWGEYEPVLPKLREQVPSSDADEELAGALHWRRSQRGQAQRLTLPPRTEQPVTYELTGAQGVHLVLLVQPVRAGMRAVSVFLVNARDMPPMTGRTARDKFYVFQAHLKLRSERAFLARPNMREGMPDQDEAIANVQYRDVEEHVVGHNVSGEAHVVGGRCMCVETTWLPTSEVARVAPTERGGVELSMDALGQADDADKIEAALGGLASQYDVWIKERRATWEADSGPHRETALGMLSRAQGASNRIRRGVALLKEDSAARRAFCLSNQAISTALRQRWTHEEPGKRRAEEAVAPRWRPFQLAFMLMNLCGLSDAKDDDRELVDLLFFPTGGGKTEAYLGLAAYTMVLRRLKAGGGESGAGVSVLMRYTLRLLTLDQLGRAATMVCALELLRRGAPLELGEWPFEIGLWVGMGATPNKMGSKGDTDERSAVRWSNNAKSNPSRYGRPIPLEVCPWCGTGLQESQLKLLPDADAPLELRFMCREGRCAFHERQSARGIPVVAVDEVIYRRLPAFLIATVDKFANLPWVGEAGMLLGGATRADREGFYGPMSGERGMKLKAALGPPELIIQDELHLISGPLGTMVGLYEAAIDALCEARGAKPKIVASTATVRRADQQIRALFGRMETEIFPPPSPDRSDSFFAHTVPVGEGEPGRLYLGVPAQGRNQKVLLLRAYLGLLGASQRSWEEAGGARAKQNPADPYMTLLGYFNSLRELGGSRRIVEDEVRSRLGNLAESRQRVGAQARFANRTRLDGPEELTSRVSTAEVAATRQRMGLTRHEDKSLDVVLATNMISVGLDISRLGLMTVLGQPKATAEYIQATSRVGRDAKRPGLVVVLFNIHRPRDRSHYERFEAWHQSFYRGVEATSVTPWSPRAMDRGLAAVTVTVARHGVAKLTPPRGASELGAHREEVEAYIEQIAIRAGQVELEASAREEVIRTVRERMRKVLDEWIEVQDERQVPLQYQREEGTYPPLLRDALDRTQMSDAAKRFKASRSMRDVEPSVHLWIKRPDEGTGWTRAKKEEGE